MTTTTTKPLSAIWQELVHKAHSWLCKQFGAVPEWQIDNAAKLVEFYQHNEKRLIEQNQYLAYKLDITNGPVWHGPWKVRKDGTGKYRSVKVAKVTYHWNTQKVSWLPNLALTAYDGDPICRGASSWYDKVPVCPWSKDDTDEQVPEPLPKQVASDVDDDESIPF